MRVLKSCQRHVILEAWYLSKGEMILVEFISCYVLFLCMWELNYTIPTSIPEGGEYGAKGLCYQEKSLNQASTWYVNTAK